MRKRAKRWCVYMLRCADGTLYTGVTVDLEARLAAHESGRGARYTRGRGPFVVARLETGLTRSRALRREAAIKRLTRGEKQALVAAGYST